MKEFDKLDEVLELYNKMEKNVEEYRKLSNELSKIRYGGYSIRGVEDKFLIEIYKKYNDKDVLNADGDLFFILEHDSKKKEYKCKRIRWDLELSEEIYTVGYWIDYSHDDEGCCEYEGTYYEIVDMVKGE